MAKITPLFKIGDMMSVINYRPLSILLTIAKLFYKILKIKMDKYLAKFSLLSDKEFGFRINKSTHPKYQIINYKKLPAIGYYSDRVGVHENVYYFYS